MGESSETMMLIAAQVLAVGVRALGGWRIAGSNDYYGIRFQPRELCQCLSVSACPVL